MDKKNKILPNIGPVVDDEQRVVVREDLVVDTDAVQVLLEEQTQLSVLHRKHELLLLQARLVQEHFVVALPELLQAQVVLHSLFMSMLFFVNHPHSIREETKRTKDGSLLRPSLARWSRAAPRASPPPPVR